MTEAEQIVKLQAALWNICSEYTSGFDRWPKNRDKAEVIEEALIVLKRTNHVLGSDDEDYTRRLLALKADFAADNHAFAGG
jgi:hypothetical protein|tara:strand:+ start:117 stop:359 length:243 start_codon:yes stop_codon:yes gene_type:complete